MENETRIPVINENQNANELWEAQLGKRIMQFFLAVAAIFIGMLVTSMPARDEMKLHHKILWPIWGLSSMITALSALTLLALLMCSTHFHRRLLTSFIFLTGLALAATYSSLLFLVKVNATIAIIVPIQKLVVVGMIAYMGTRNRERHDTAYDEAYESEMDCGFDLSKLSNAAAFTVQTVLIVSYLKNSSSSEAPAPRADHAITSPCEFRPSRADLAITYFASMLCLCSMMITCMPLRFGVQDTRGCLLATVKVLNYAMLVALAWIATTLAAEFLEGMVVFSFTLLLVAYAFFVFWEFQDRAPEAQRANRTLEIMKEYKNMCIGTMAVAYYTILVFIYSNNPGREIDSLLIKFFVLVLLTAIISGLALTPFTLKPPRQNSSVVAKIMASFAGLLVLIVCVIVVYACINLY
ncbi:uncharacterized protein [Typha latifolia]|uniref:uncharacterized protein n=1 Tax=Typha latifolia TaxID=4733 RepID=UPI003C3014CD